MSYETALASKARWLMSLSSASAAGASAAGSVVTEAVSDAARAINGGAVGGGGGGGAGSGDSPVPLPALRSGAWPRGGGFNSGCAAYST